MSIAYFVLSMILSRQGWETSVFPFFIMLYGLGTFISGCIIKFRPLIVAASLLRYSDRTAYAGYDYQMLCAAAAILISYIIPAYMLLNKANE